MRWLYMGTYTHSAVIKLYSTRYQVRRPKALAKLLKFALAEKPGPAWINAEGVYASAWPCYFGRGLALA